MVKKQVWLTVALLASACTLYAMGHKMPANDEQDSTFNAKAEINKPDPHVADATSEKDPVALPAAPSDVEKDTAKDFNDPFFKPSESEKDPDFDVNKK